MTIQDDVAYFIGLKVGEMTYERASKKERKMLLKVARKWLSENTCQL